MRTTPTFRVPSASGDHRGAVPGADRKGHRVALDRIDREVDAERAKQSGAAVAESDDAGIRRHMALVGDDPGEPAIADVEGANRLCVAKLDTGFRAVAGQPLGEQMRIPRLVVGVVDPAGDRLSLCRERGLELDASAGVEDLVRQADLTQGPRDVPRARDRRLVAKQMKGAAKIGVVVDPGFLDQLRSASSCCTGTGGRSCSCCEATRSRCTGAGIGLPTPAVRVAPRAARGRGNLHAPAIRGSCEGCPETPTGRTCSG